MLPPHWLYWPTTPVGELVGEADDLVGDDDLVGVGVVDCELVTGDPPHGSTLR